MSEKEIKEEIMLIADGVAELSAKAGGMLYEDIFQKVMECLEPDE